MPSDQKHCKGRKVPGADRGTESQNESTLMREVRVLIEKHYPEHLVVLEPHRPVQHVYASVWRVLCSSLDGSESPRVIMVGSLLNIWRTLKFDRP